MSDDTDLPNLSALPLAPPVPTLVTIMPPGQILCTHPTADARLLEFNLRAYKDVIQAAVRSAVPLLDHRPPLPAMYGRPVNMPRNLGFFCAPGVSYGYFFSRQLAAAKPITVELATLLELVNRLFGTEYNGALVNEYEDGDSSIADHRDDELGLDNARGVLSISFGAERKFQIKHWNPATNAPFPKKEKPWCEVPTKSCYALLMAGEDFQRVFSHGVPKQKGVGRRVSITWRRHDKGKEETLYRNWLKKQEAGE